MCEKLELYILFLLELLCPISGVNKLARRREPLDTCLENYPIYRILYVFMAVQGILCRSLETMSLDGIGVVRLGSKKTIR
jgi:hypothetical protein